MDYYHQMHGPVAVVETEEFLAAARKLLREDERAALVDYLASNPTAGDLIQGTGGVRFKAPVASGSCAGHWRDEESVAVRG